MVALLRLLRSFSRDDRGVFAVVFGLIAVVLIATAGSTVDYIRIQQARTTIQVLLDAAALALQREIYSGSEAEISEKAERLLLERSRETGIDVAITSVEIRREEGALRLAATVSIETAFVTLVGVHRLSAFVLSEASRERLSLEIAMVLDNSGSMATGSRMGHLKSAANKASTIFFNDMNPDSPDVFVGVVPFTQFVNVGRQYANAAWIDRFGLSEIADDNLVVDANSPQTGFNRIELFGRLRNAPWRGCVEARAYPLDTNDDVPEASRPDTLFVPAFAPDEPDAQDRYGRDLYNNSYLADQPRQCAPPPNGSSYSQRVLQERMCKYTNASVTKASMTQAQGPNADCPNNPLTPLTSSSQTIIQAIASMTPQGGTNIAQGAVWGLHLLSENEPFAAAPFAPDNRKVMILMTDGDNFHSASPNMNGARFYTAYGYPYNSRLGQLGDSTQKLQGFMDARLLETCQNAKGLGIVVYTIGLAVARTETEKILQSCSSGEGYWFLPQQPNELDAIFEQIAGQLAELRLTM